MNALEVKSIRKEYDEFTLESVSFEIPKGYIMGFVGENGAGKTTTIKSILNVISRTSGEIKIFGKNIDDHELEIKQDIGYLSGESFYPKKKLSQITNTYKRFFDNWDQNIYENYLKKFGLSEAKKVYELSKGMQIKYALTLALSHNAKLLILDEPTSGLDPYARDNLLEIFQELVENGEVSILYSTHITSDLDKCADYVTFIQEGRVVESCSKDDLLDKYSLFHTSKDNYHTLQPVVIASKENAFGVNGLIKTTDMVKHKDIQYARPNIDDIIIFYAEKGGRK